MALTTVPASMFASAQTPSFNGIAFPATQSASSDANTLDDYEEGTWTPSLGGTAVYDIQNGFYIKIGRLVFCSGAIRPTSIGTGSPSNIFGLPFAVGGGDGGGGPGYYDGCASSVYSISFDIGGPTNFGIYCKTAAGTSAGGTTFFQSNTRLYFNIVYYTTA